MGTMELELALAGEKVVVAGLVLQVVTFVVFLAAAIDFHIRISRTTSASDATSASTKPAWKSLLNVLYILSVLILFRCTFRLIEYVMGNAAYLIAHEWTLYAFDAVPMFAVLVLLLVFQPNQIATPGERKVHESSDGEMGVVRSQ